MFRKYPHPVTYWLNFELLRNWLKNLRFHALNKYPRDTYIVHIKFEFKKCYLGRNAYIRDSGTVGVLLICVTVLSLPLRSTRGTQFQISYS